MKIFYSSLHIVGKIVQDVYVTERESHSYPMRSLQLFVLLLYTELFKNELWKKKNLPLLFIYSGTKCRQSGHKICHLLDTQIRLSLLESLTIMSLVSCISFENYIRVIDGILKIGFSWIPNYTCVSSLWVFGGEQAFSFSLVLWFLCFWVGHSATSEWP